MSRDRDYTIERDATGAAVRLVTTRRERPACIACEQPNERPSPTLPQMCSGCWWKLPAETRAAYQSGRLDLKRMSAIGRERVQSVRKIGGGRHGTVR